MFMILAAAMAAQAPSAIIDGRESDRTDNLSYPVKIVAINGKAYWDGRDFMEIEPGFNYIELATTNESRGGRVTTNPFPMMAKPCVRYLVSAKHERATDARRWAIRVVEEPIGGCEAPAAEAPAETNAAPRSAEPAEAPTTANDSR